MATATTDTDRRHRAWTFLALGLLVAWGSLGFATETGHPAVWALFIGAVASVVYGITLFDKPRR